MKRINILLLLSLFLSLVSAARVSVSIVDFAFVPDTVQIFQHDSVIWTNNGIFLHTSTSGVNGVWDSLWDSGDLSSGQSFSHAFLNVGNFPYFCQHHYLAGMHGLVRVSPSGINEGNSLSNNLNNLLEVYPNPFYSSIKITYSYNLPTNIKLQIYSVSGQLVRNIATNSAKPGTYSVVWDGRDNENQMVRKGIYFCLFSSGNKDVRDKFLKLE
jgi:plastocyanin